jgi:hypothetical protein
MNKMKFNEMLSDFLWNLRTTGCAKPQKSAGLIANKSSMSMAGKGYKAQFEIDVHPPISHFYIENSD